MLFNRAAESKQAPLNGPGRRNFCACLGKPVAGCSALEETACLENGISHPTPIIWLRIETVQETLLASEVSLVRKWGISSSQGASRAPDPTPAGGGQSGPSHPLRITHTQHLGLVERLSEHCHGSILLLSHSHLCGPLGTLEDKP